MDISLNMLYENCKLCPHMCRINRAKGKRGICGETDKLRIAWAGLYYGEEPPITGKGGSGTIFFTGCTLGCIFCQNYQISHEGLGEYIAVEKLAYLMLELQKHGAENINLVTGTHFAPHIIEALKIAKAYDTPLDIPIVWNTSGFENMETLGLLKNHIDVYLTDMKSLDASFSREFIKSSRYPEYAVKAVDKMVRQKHLKIIGGKIKEGVIIRHLVVPWAVDATKDFLILFRKRWYKWAILSLMFQYIPPRNVRQTNNKRIISKKLCNDDVEMVLDWLAELGIEKGFIHDIEEYELWETDFFQDPPFPTELSRGIWHWSKSYHES